MCLRTSADIAADLARNEAELASVDAVIDAAYWRFTRQARAKPPVLAEPAAYERRTVLRRHREALKAELRRTMDAGCTTPEPTHDEP